MADQTGSASLEGIGVPKTSLSAEGVAKPLRLVGSPVGRVVRISQNADRWLPISEAPLASQAPVVPQAITAPEARSGSGSGQTLQAPGITCSTPGDQTPPVPHANPGPQEPVSQSTYPIPMGPHASLHDPPPPYEAFPRNGAPAPQIVPAYQSPDINPAGQPPQGPSDNRPPQAPQAPASPLPAPGPASAPAPNNQYQCLQCGNFFKSRGGYQTHVRESHIGTKCYWRGCDRTFATERELLDHLKAHQDLASNYHNEPVCQWPGCGVRTRAMANVFRHLKRHNNIAHRAADAHAAEAFRSQQQDMPLQ